MEESEITTLIEASPRNDLTFTSGDITYNLVPFIVLIILIFALRIFSLIGLDLFGGLDSGSSGSGYGSSSYDAPSTSYGSPSSGYGAPSSSYGSPSSSYGSPSSSYGSPSSSYGSPSSSYGLKTGQDLYYLYPGAATSIDDNFGNIDLTKTDNDYLTRLLNVNTGATQGNIAGVNVQYPSYNPYLAAVQLQQQQLQEQQLQQLQQQNLQGVKKRK